MPTSACEAFSLSGLPLHDLRAGAETTAPRRFAHRRRYDIFSQRRIDPGFDGATVAFPEALQHSNQLLAMALRAQDVVMEDGTTKDG
jgi:hypothetical protein